MKLLIIEDNADLVANIYDFFEARGHAVDAAYDAFSGLKFASEHSYDAIVLDLMLPGMDGLEVCARLRDTGVTTPILMLTARDTLDNKLDGFASGADDYLIKPFALSELDARLQAIHRRAAGGPVRTEVRVADLHFNPDTLEITRGGIPIQLPPIPLRIFELLLQRSPRVVSREELEHAVWGDSPPDSDPLRAHIHVLRSAIDGASEQPLIQTIRGRGYRLAAPDAD